MIISKNLLKHLPNAARAEVFQVLLEKKNIKIERIVSRGQVTPQGKWYDQSWTEWVVVLQGKARLRFYGKKKLIDLSLGDCLTIPAHVKHRVEWTSPKEKTVWLAVHIRSQI